jgi:hypothetical protein
VTDPQQYLLLLRAYLGGEISLEQMTERSRGIPPNSDGESLVGIDLESLNSIERGRMKRLIEAVTSPPPDAL